MLDIQNDPMRNSSNEIYIYQSQQTWVSDKCIGTW